MAKVAYPSKNVEEPYDGVGESKWFQQNVCSCAQPLHYVEECKYKRIDEESHGRTERRRIVQKDIPWHYHFVGYELKY